MNQVGLINKTQVSYLNQMKYGAYSPAERSLWLLLDSMACGQLNSNGCPCVIIVTFPDV